MARTNTKTTKKNTDIITLKGDNVTIEIRPYEDGNLLGFATVTIYGFIKIYNCRVVKGTKGTFLALPSYKGSNDKYYSHCYIDPTDKDGKFVTDEIDGLLSDWSE